MNHICSLHEALEIFEENLAEIRTALIDNAGAVVQMYKPYAEKDIESICDIDSIHLHVNYLRLQSRMTPILNSVKRIDSYRYYKDPRNETSTVVTEMDIERSRQVDADWFIAEAQLSTRKPHKGLCVFHADTNPSLTLMKSKSKGTLYLKCFACSWFGDSIKYIMDRDKLDFINAVKKITCSN